MPKDYSHILLASDIDGTFIDSQSRTVQRNLDAVKRFTTAGGNFAFATGRYETNLGDVVPNFEKYMNIPGIFCNGAYIYDPKTNKITDSIWLDGEYTLGILRSTQARYPSLSIRCTCRSGNYHIRNIPDSEIPRDAWYKVIFIGEPDILDEAREYMKGLSGERFIFSKSSFDLLELLDRSATKGTMLLRLKQKISEKLGHDMISYAIGDYENDIAMLRAADVAVCPENALDIVKAVCDIKVCSCGAGAVAELIDLIMNEK